MVPLQSITRCDSVGRQFVMVSSGHSLKARSVHVTIMRCFSRQCFQYLSYTTTTIKRFCNNMAFLSTYCASVVRSFLDEHFHSRWIGHRGPLEWPARSPDLTPPDFLWGVLKHQIYHRRALTIPQLKPFIMRKCRRFR